MKKIDYDGYRFPPAIIQQAIWLYSSADCAHAPRKPTTLTSRQGLRFFDYLAA
jgi:hypothetical protein